MASAPRHIHRFLLILFFLLTFNSLNVFAQATKVKGRVVDASSGEGIPFAGVYFNNSTTGVSTDMDGYFLLETRNSSLNVLTASILGYVPQELPVDPGQFNELHFRLVPALNELDAVIVKPDDSYVRWILSQVDSAKRFNDPERRERYNCDVYSKMELDLSNADTKLIREMVPRNFDFVYDYLDTSVVSGQPYLPVMITESTSKYYYQRDPKERREVILASRISGIENEATLAQFTGNMLVKINFYDNFLQLFEINIPSPISASGTTYYNYYLIDSLKIDGRKTYKIRFHPSKWVSSPTFDGEMSIDAKDFALRDIHAKLKKGNVNWIRALMIDVEHQPLADSSWFYKQDKLYVDFSVTMRDSSKMIAFLGNRQIDYSNPRFDSLSVEESPRSADFIQLGKNVLKNDEEYWQSVRPYPLSAREQGIYNMVDSIKNVPLYHDIASVVNTGDRILRFQIHRDRPLFLPVQFQPAGGEPCAAWHPDHEGSQQEGPCHALRRLRVQGPGLEGGRYGGIHVRQSADPEVGGALQARHHADRPRGRSLRQRGHHVLRAGQGGRLEIEPRQRLFSFLPARMVIGLQHVNRPGEPADLLEPLCPDVFPGQRALQFRRL